MEAVRAEAVGRYFEAGGNGVAMRVLPHAVLHADAEEPAAMLKDVVVDGAATHGHPRALVGAAAYAYAAWWLLRAQHTVGFGELLTVLLDTSSTWGLPPARPRPRTDGSTPGPTPSTTTRSSGPRLSMKRGNCSISD